VQQKSKQSSADASSIGGQTKLGRDKFVKLKSVLFLRLINKDIMVLTLNKKYIFF